MIRITQLKLPVQHDKEELLKRASAALRVRPSRIRDLCILRRAVDARHKDDLKYVYTLGVSLKDEKTFSVGKNRNISFYEPAVYRFPFRKKGECSERPVIVGSGPAGLFCALFLAENGYAAEPVWETMSTTALISAVSGGIGISVLPGQMALQAAAKKEVWLARVEGIRFTQHYYLVWHRDKYRNPAMEEFIRMVRTSGNEMNINE